MPLNLFLLIMIELDNIKIKTVEQSRISEVDFQNIPFGKIYSDHIFVADFADGDWKNLKITPYDYLRISPGNSALHYGQSVFEGMKAYRNVDGKIAVFRPYQNFERINRSAERMCIPGLPEEVFMGGLNELLRIDKNWIPEVDGTSLYIRPFIFATDEYIGIRPSDTYKFIIFTCPVGPYYNGAVKVKIETRYTRAIEGGTGYAKAAGNYGASIYPARLAQQTGINQLIWTDGKTHQYIEESGTMNIAFIIGDALITPPAGETILKGITRDSILTLARDRGMLVEERPVSVTEVISALKNGSLKEAFGMGTAATVASIEMIRFEDHDYYLPDLKQWKHAPSFLQELDDIKTGKIEDRHNWVYLID